jgi:hypothetical protein
MLNKKLWEELIAYFLWYDRTRVFVAAVFTELLPSNDSGT